MNTPQSHNKPHKKMVQFEENEIVYCYECKLYHIHYETLSIDLSLKGLFSMMENLEEHILTCGGIYADDKRWMEIVAPGSHIRLYFSMNDCRILAGMIVDCINIIKNQAPQGRWN